MKPCECGCGKPAPIVKNTDPERGYVKGEPHRFIHGHNARGNSVAAAMFERAVDFDGPDGCWAWQYALDVQGYGKLVVDGKARKVHRVFYEALVGPIPDGLVIDHLCRNRGCVNPDHLEPVTNAENLRRSRFTHCKHGHPYDEVNTYVSPQGRRYCRACQHRRKQEHIERQIVAA